MANEAATTGKQAPHSDLPSESNPDSAAAGRDALSRLVEKVNASGGGLISILEEIQARYGYLPEAILVELARNTGRSLVDIYGVATFYRAFSLKPRGRHLCSVCIGTACHVRGAPAVEREFERKLGVQPGGTTADREFTLETVNCLGACALGPIAVIDGHYFSNVTAARVGQILDKTRAGLDRVVISGDQRVFPVEVSCPRCNHSLMDHEHLVDGLPGIRVTVSFGRKHGWLWLSCLYGSYTVESEYRVPESTVANFFCPHCHGEMVGASHCPECGVLMVPMFVRGGGVVQICPRRGCNGHMLDVNGVHI